MSLRHLSHLRHLRWLRPVTLVGMAGTAAVAAVAHSAGSPDRPASVLGGQLVKGDDAGEGAAAFVVSGDVGDLAPGVTRQLRLRLTNPNLSGIAVQTLEVTVGDSPSGCSGANLGVGALPGPVFVPGGGEAQVSLPVTMSSSASSICEGTTFPLTYGGSAVNA